MVVLYILSGLIALVVFLFILLIAWHAVRDFWGRLKRRKARHEIPSIGCPECEAVFGADVSASFQEHYTHYHGKGVSGGWKPYLCFACPHCGAQWEFYYGSGTLRRSEP